MKKTKAKKKVAKKSAAKKAGKKKTEKKKESKKDTDITVMPLTQIGETAGAVWHALNKKGQLPLAKLSDVIDAPRDVVMQAVGWLAREDKIEIDETNRGQMVSLRQGF